MAGALAAIAAFGAAVAFAAVVFLAGATRRDLKAVSALEHTISRVPQADEVNEYTEVIAWPDWLITMDVRAIALDEMHAASVMRFVPALRSFMHRP